MTVTFKQDAMVSVLGGSWGAPAFLVQLQVSVGGVETSVLMPIAAAKKLQAELAAGIKQAEDDRAEDRAFARKVSKR